MFTNPLTQVFAQTKKLIKKRWTEKTQTGESVSAQAMSDELFLAQFDLAEVSALVVEAEIEAAKKALLAHYEQRTTPAWPRCATGCCGSRAAPSCRLRRRSIRLDTAEAPVRRR